jgi:hypothetical protein
MCTVYEYSVTHTNIRAPRVNMYVLILPINMCSFILLIINIYEVTAIRIPGSQCSRCDRGSLEAYQQNTIYPYLEICYSYGDANSCGRRHEARNIYKKVVSI